MRKHTHEKSKSSDCFIPIVLCIPAFLFARARLPSCLPAFVRRHLVANGKRLFFIDTIFAFPCLFILHSFIFYLICFDFIFGYWFEHFRERKKTEKDRDNLTCICTYLLFICVYVYKLFRITGSSFWGWWVEDGEEQHQLRVGR